MSKTTYNFSKLLLLSGLFIQQNSLYSAAGFPAKVDLGRDVLAGKQLNQLEQALIYSTKINISKISGKAPVGIEFGFLINKLNEIANLNNPDLYMSLLNAAREAIYNNDDYPVNIPNLNALKQEFKRLEVSGKIPQRVALKGAPREITPNMKKYVLWPFLIWAIENDNADLALHLVKILGYNTKAEGRKFNALEIAEYWGYKKTLDAIKQYKASQEGPAAAVAPEYSTVVAPPAYADLFPAGAAAAAAPVDAPPAYADFAAGRKKG